MKIERIIWPRIKLERGEKFHNETTSGEWIVNAGQHNVRY